MALRLEGNKTKELYYSFLSLKLIFVYSPKPWSLACVTDIK